MKIEYTKKFRKQFSKLDNNTREQFKKRQRLWIEDPYNPQLRLHELRGKYAGLYSINITADIRAIYEKVDETYYIYGFIGSHSKLY